jgi:hypothetical protein
MRKRCNTDAVMLKSKGCYAIIKSWAIQIKKPEYLFDRYWRSKCR